MVMYFMGELCFGCSVISIDYCESFIMVMFINFVCCFDMVVLVVCILVSGLYYFLNMSIYCGGIFMVKDVVVISIKKKWQIFGFFQMQCIGCFFMFLIVFLLVVVLFMWFGFVDVFGVDGFVKYVLWMQLVVDVLVGVGGVIFDNLFFIFVLGVVVGYVKKVDGLIVLVVFVGYFIFIGVGILDKI